MNVSHSLGLIKEIYPKFEIIERNMQGWEFQSATTTDSDQMICYTRVKDNGKFKEVIEIYSGENYVLNSTKKSYSRVYTRAELPYKYQSIVLGLSEILADTLKTKLLIP